MGTGSLWHWIILLLVVVLLFGRGKVSELMGDFAKGIKSFKKGMSDDEPEAAERPAPRTIDAGAPADDGSPERTKTS